MNNLEMALEGLRKQASKVELEGRAANLIAKRIEFGAYFDNKLVKMSINPRITGRIMDEGFAMFQEQMKNNKALTQLSATAVKMQKVLGQMKAGNETTLNPEDFTEVISMNFTDIGKSVIDTRREDLKFNANFVKLFLDASKLKAEQLAEYNSEDWWLEQDAMELANLADYFRSKLNISKI